MPKSPLIDLYGAESWLGVKPGMTLAEVQAAMKLQGAVGEDYDDGNFTTTADDWELDFYFTTDGTDRLRQVSIMGEAVRWNGRPIMDEPLDTVLSIMEPIGRAMWQAHDAMCDPFPTTTPESTGPITDEKLLQEGTLWLTDRGLGLTIWSGDVAGLIWRAPQDLPTLFDSPLTDAQRQLSVRPDLDEHLLEKRMEKIALETPPDPMRWPKRLVTLATIASLAWAGYRGFNEARLWNQAPIIQAKFIGTETVTMKQFRDYVPPVLRWMVPPTHDVRVDAYRVGFEDPTGQHHEVVLERGELYVPPQNVGDEVPVVWVPGNPDRISGASRARDHAFIETVPIIIVIGAASLILHLALSMIPAILRIAQPGLKKLVPPATIKDPDRPELR